MYKILVEQASSLFSHRQDAGAAVPAPEEDDPQDDRIPVG
jgi:hypothetical protein